MKTCPKFRNRLKKLKKYKTSRKWINLFAIFTILILLPIAAFIYFNNSKTAEASWFDDSWAYRKAITITVTSSSSDIKDLATNITVDTTGITSKLRTSCQDLRFTSQTGKLLPYYFSSCSNNSATNKIWVMVDLVPKNTTTYIMYMYYGNSSASSKSDSNKFALYNGLQGYWPMNESSWNGTSGEVKDLSGNGNNGTADCMTAFPVGNCATAKPNTTAGKYGNAGSFTGTDQSTAQMVKLANSANLSPGTGDFTIAAWVNINTLNGVDSWIYGDYSADGNSLVLLRVGTTNKFNFYFRDSSGNNTITADNTTALSTGNWYHVVAVKQGTTGYIYVNAVSENSNTNSSLGTITTSDGTVPVIGKYADPAEVNSRYPFRGKIDDLRIYNRALSASDVIKLYNDSASSILTAGTGPASASFGSEEVGKAPVAYWKFDEGQGQTASDSSSNKNNGTLAGTTKPTWQSEDLCVSGKCLFFDGSTSNTTVANAINGVQTVSMWVRPITSASTALIDLDGGTHKITTDASSVVSAGGFTSPTYYINGVQQSSPTLTANQWQYVTITTATGFNSTSSLTIGKSGATYFKGFIDDIKVYNYARTAAQIKNDYASRNSVKGSSSVMGAKDQSYLSNNLLGYWKLDESSGNVSDSSGNSLTLTNNGVTTFVGGKFANGSNHNGTTQYFNTATAINGIKTVSFWANPGNTTNYYINLINSSTYITSSGGTFSATGFTSPSIYVNGVLNGTISASAWSLVTITTTTGVNASAFAVGLTNDGSNHFYTNGSKMDEIRLYNRALSQKEVTDLYNWAPSPTAYFDFEDGSGGTVTDRMGTGNGTWSGTGTTHWTSGKYGKGGKFNGTDDYVSKSSPSFITDTQGTISLWVKLANNTQYSTIWGIARDVTANSEVRVDYRGDDTKQLQVAVIQNGTILFSGLTTANAITNTNWHHITLTSNASTIKLYVDGIENVPNQSVLGTNSGQWFSSATSANNFTVGILKRATPILPFAGKVDDIKVYNYARSVKQIVEDMLGSPNRAVGAGGGNAGQPAVGYWKFDEGVDNKCAGGTNDACNSGSGGSALDGAESGMAVPATSTSGWTNSGKFGKALLFDGTNDYISIADSAALKPSQITIAFWINLGQTSANRRIMQKGDLTGSWTINQGWSSIDNKIDFGIYDGSWENLHGNTALTGSTWYHVAITYDSSKQVKIYLNGVLDKSGTFTKSLPQVAVQMTMGTESATGFGTTYFQGTLDEVKIYNYALTQNEVKTEYNHGSSLVLGALSDNSSYQKQAANQEYCIPGDTTSCVSPVGEWKLEEGSGITVNSTGTGTNITGTLTNSPTWTTGKYGKAVNFDGVNDYITMGDPSNGSLDPQGNPFSLSAWVKTTDTGGFILSKQYGANTNGDYGMYVNGNGTVTCGISQSSSQRNSRTSSASINNGNWNHVFCNFTAYTVSPDIYINGVLSNGTFDGPMTVAPGNSTQSFVIGNGEIARVGDSTYALRAQIDEVRYYNYARSAAQVAWDYNRGAPVGLWRFDECQGLTAYDSSGNGNDGTITIGTGAGTGHQDSAGTCTVNAATAWYNGATGKYNASLNFDGIDDYVTITSNSILRSIKSFSGWFNIPSTDSNSRVMFNHSDSTNGGEWYLAKSTGNAIQFDWIDQTTGAWTATTLLSSFTTGTWYHFAFVKTGTTTADFYINGKKVATATNGWKQDAGYGVKPLTFGVFNGISLASYGLGQVDDVRVYNYGLTGTQVKLLYNENSAVRFAPVTGSP